MKPVDPPDHSSGQFALGDGKDFVVYSSSASVPPGYTARWIDPKSGKVSAEKPAGGGSSALWLTHP